MQHPNEQVLDVGVISLDLATSMLSPSPEFCRIFGLPEVKEVLVGSALTSPVRQQQL